MFCTLKLLVSFSIVEADNVYASRFCQAAFYTPETKFGGVYRSHPVVDRLVGRSVGWSVGRAVGRSVQRSVAFSFSNTTSYNDQAHGEKVQCTRKITPS